MFRQAFPVQLIWGGICAENDKATILNCLVSTCKQEEDNLAWGHCIIILPAYLWQHHRSTDPYRHVFDLVTTCLSALSTTEAVVYDDSPILLLWPHHDDIWLRQDSLLTDAKYQTLNHVLTAVDRRIFWCHMRRWALLSQRERQNSSRWC